ncbi:MAG: flagellar protein FlgN [Thermodesulfobacteriota bacterium]|nr:flagellar protein FlgN [Thermodesulfobacteriota bacterium]
MDLLLNKFLGLLEDITVLYRSLLSVFKKEKMAVLDSDLESLNEAGKEKENIILKIRILEEQRINMLKRIADFLNRPSQFLTLTELSQLLAEPYSTRFKECSSDLLALSQSIKDANQSNKTLLMHSLEFVRSSFSLLDNLIAPNYVYYRSGRIQENKRCGRVLSGMV